MLRILYAADNRTSSHYTLRRFLDTYSQFYDIRVAAYTKSIRDLNVNWTLDALLDFRGVWSGISFKNTNYALYIREVKRFAPDLIISDTELYSSYMGLELGIPVWQISPLLLYYGVKHQQKHDIYKYHSGVFASSKRVQQYLTYVVNNSDKRLILSHLGDAGGLTLREGYEWARPNHPTENTGYSMQLADNYYANEPANFAVDYGDLESIITSYYNDYCKLNAPFKIQINPDVKFLSQHIKMLGI